MASSYVSISVNFCIAIRSEDYDFCIAALSADGFIGCLSFPEARLSSAIPAIGGVYVVR